MAKTRAEHIEQVFEIKCQGRNEAGTEVLRRPAHVKVRIYQHPSSDMISSDVSNCKFNCGPHGENCKAYNPESQIPSRVICPYSFDIPYALEHLNQRG
jgi:hypothetical protein